MKFGALSPRSVAQGREESWVLGLAWALSLDRAQAETQSLGRKPVMALEPWASHAHVNTHMSRR